MSCPAGARRGRGWLLVHGLLHGELTPTSAMESSSVETSAVESSSGGHASGRGVSEKLLGALMRYVHREADVVYREAGLSQGPCSRPRLARGFRVRFRGRATELFHVRKVVTECLRQLRANLDLVLGLTRDKGDRFLDLARLVESGNLTDRAGCPLCLEPQHLGVRSAVTVYLIDATIPHRVLRRVGRRTSRPPRRGSRCDVDLAVTCERGRNRSDRDAGVLGEFVLAVGETTPPGFRLEPLDHVPALPDCGLAHSRQASQGGLDRTRHAKRCGSWPTQGLCRGARDP